MASAAFEEIVEDFEFLEDWEDRYRYVSEKGRDMAPLDEALKVPATKVEGCASQVWLHIRPEGGAFHFDGDSDAMIVRGLVAILVAYYSGRALDEVSKLDVQAFLTRLQLEEHLTPQRSNGLNSMVKRIRADAARLAAEAV